MVLGLRACTAMHHHNTSSNPVSAEPTMIAVGGCRLGKVLPCSGYEQVEQAAPQEQDLHAGYWQVRQHG